MGKEGSDWGEVGSEVENLECLDEGRLWIMGNC